MKNFFIFLFSILSMTTFGQMQITNFSVSNNVCNLSWVHDQTNYIVQYRKSLSSGTWLNVTNQVLSSPTSSITNNFTNCFYRIKRVRALSFPDAKFRSAVMSAITYKYYPTNQIFDLDVESVITIDANNKGIANLTGVKELVKLQDLYVNENNISSLDVSGMSSLKNLECYNNNISSLNVSGCTNLYLLSCYMNNISSLNLSSCTNLNAIDCQYNNIKNLDLTSNKNIWNIYCQYNGMTNLNVTGCKYVYLLNCSQNNLVGTIDLSADNNMLSYLNATVNNLTSIHVSVFAIPDPFLYDAGVTIIYH